MNSNIENIKEYISLLEYDKDRQRNIGKTFFATKLAEFIRENSKKNLSPEYKETLATTPIILVHSQGEAQRLRGKGDYEAVSITGSALSQRGKATSFILDQDAALTMLNSLLIENQRLESQIKRNEVSYR